MNPKALKYTEIALFYGGVTLNIWILCHFTFFGGNDGPSHLYYSRVIKYLLEGNEFLSKYFVLNHLPVPNITDHYLLALFDVFFRSSISEKILLFIFVAGFPFIFRAIVYKYNPEGIAASSFIIPFTHCTLLYLGAYNFCLSFTFFFIAVYYFFKSFSDASKLYTPLKYILFFLLILLNYFTNAVSFLFLFSICGMAELYWLYRQRKPKAISKKQIVKRLLLFGAIWIPAFIMLNIFNNAIPGLHHENTLNLQTGQLLGWLYNMQCLSVNLPGEEIYTHLILSWIIITLCVVIYLRVKDKAAHRFFLTDIFLLYFILTLIAYFIIPQGAGVGMISDRLLYYLIIFLVLWLALQKNRGEITLLLSGVIMAIHVVFFFHVHYPLLTNLNNDALDVQKASKYVTPNGIVAVFKIDGNPLEPSISNILGVDKPLVVLERYEPDYGWFAVNRTMGKEPKWQVHILPNNQLVWFDVKNNKVIALIDDVIVYGDYYAALTSGIGDLKKLELAYTKVFSSDDNKVHIFRLNK
ncbi:MAG TPA: hypothetical protein VK809_06030 [Bacteroidia bacterium]|nr:hypothetical protein [Bacteroidia bacterium]